MLRIERATLKDLQAIVPLFDAYRVFYKQVSNPEIATSFLRERLTQGDAVIFLAFHSQKPIGFTQLYTTFSSVSIQRYFILNDLFVDPAYRNRGIGKALLNKAKQHCITSGYKGLALETAKDNPAQHLYEQLDWERDEQYLHYFWKNSE
ncbi:MAG: GNAT family N-acetyltransferase [Bacteroidota bacterium]